MVSTATEQAAGRNSPVAPSSRIEGIDILRGITLFGVLAINAVFEFRVSIFEQFLPADPVSGIDGVLKEILAAVIELKALAIFSLLFGVGLAIQFDRLADHPRRLALLVRRLVILLVLGAGHLMLLWNGDILLEYAVAGFIVLPLLFGPKWLVLSAAAAALLVYLAMPLLPPVVPFPSNIWIRDHLADAATVYGQGSFLDVLAFRIKEIPAILPLHVLILPRTIALFLFGVVVWRCGIFRRAAQQRGFLFALATGGILLGGVLIMADHGRAGSGLLSLGRASEVVERLGGIILAAGYAATIVGLVSIPAGKQLLAWAAPVGRTAFTNYLAQSVVLGVIFYGYGFGLFGRLGVTAALAIAVVVYAAQVAISAWWLRRYRFGPVEWLWRSLMYGNREPMVQRLR